MAIHRLEVKNFKTFKDLTLDLNRLNVLIGINASGKSNFVEILNFLNNLNTYGLEDAISMEGGINYLQNLKIGKSKPTSLKFLYEYELSDAVDSIIEVEGKTTGMRPTRFEYNLKIYTTEEDKYEIEEELEIFYKFFNSFESRKEMMDVIKNNKKTQKMDCFIGDGKIDVFRNRENILDFKPHIPEGSLITDKILFPEPSFSKKWELRNNLTMIEWYIPIPPFSLLGPNIIGIYDIDPKSTKKVSQIRGKMILDKNGENLPLVLDRIVSDEEAKRKFSNILKNTLPFVSDISTEKFFDNKSVCFKLSESYNPDNYLPASITSDGTVAIVALIVALYFEPSKLKIFEEPERHIHPYLISRIIDMFEDVKEDRQIIITTHNPQTVKSINIDDLLLMVRDDEGFSNISRPANNEDVRSFLKDELGIDELYVNNIWE